MADLLQFNAPFNLKNFLASKGTSGLESIFHYVPEKMKLSILQAMHKIHPNQAVNFMRDQLRLPTNKPSTLTSWMIDKVLASTSTIDNVSEIPYNTIKDLRLKLANPSADVGLNKWNETFLKMRTTDAGKYQLALLDQLNAAGKEHLWDPNLDFGESKFEEPKIWEKTPKKGIPWSKIGMRLLNNPFTRFVGGAGNVALAGQALLDIGTGSEHTGNMMRNFNEMMNVPYKDDGTVWRDTQAYENFMNPPPPAVGQPGGAPVERFNRGGLASFVL